MFLGIPSLCHAAKGDEGQRLARLIRSAQPGDTVTLPAGTFALGDVTVPPQVSIKGAGYAKTILDARKFQAGLRILDVRPAGESTEDLWFEILTWEDQVLVGKMVDGGSHTTEWRKGATVEVEEDQINAIALGREGKTLEEEEMGRLLTAERPV